MDSYKDSPCNTVHETHLVKNLWALRGTAGAEKFTADETEDVFLKGVALSGISNQVKSVEEVVKGARWPDEPWRVQLPPNAHQRLRTQ